MKSSDRNSFLIPLCGILAASVICLFLGASVPRDAVNNGYLQSTMDGGMQCITNLECIQVGTETVSNLIAGQIIVSNIVAQYFTVTNLTVVNLTVVSNVVIQGVILGTNEVDLFASYTLVPEPAGNPTNTYVLDGGVTNGAGKHVIYADLTPTNDIFIAGVTNFPLGRMLSFDVLAIANRNVFFPTNLFLNTNGGFLMFTNDGVFLSNNLWCLPVPAGHYLRFDVRNNPNGLEPQFEIKP